MPKYHRKSRYRVDNRLLHNKYFEKYFDDDDTVTHPVIGVSNLCEEDTAIEVPMDFVIRNRDLERKNAILTERLNKLKEEFDDLQRSYKIKDIKNIDLERENATLIERHEKVELGWDLEGTDNNTIIENAQTANKFKDLNKKYRSFLLNRLQKLQETVSNCQTCGKHFVEKLE